MSAKLKRRGKMGRPHSGNKPFSIRMRPETKADLLRAAKNDGYQSLGAWLNAVPVEIVYKLSSPARLKNASPDLLNQAFLEYATEVARIFAEMRLIVERNPMFDQDAANRNAFKKLKREYDSLIGRMADFGYEV